MKRRDSLSSSTAGQNLGKINGRSAFWPAQLPSKGETQGNMRRSRILMLAAGTLLILGTLLAYLPTFRAEFLPFDDQEYVYLNSHVTDGISWDSMIWAFKRVSVANWHPLTWLSHMIDVELFGLDPHGHHASSIAWHVINVLLLFVVMKYLTGQALPSLCLAALFALHPAHVEVVGWVAQRKTLISTFFILLTIAAYATYVRRRSWRWYVCCLVCFVFSLMAKQTFVTLPALLVLLDFWPLRRGLTDATLPPHPNPPPRKAGGEGTDAATTNASTRKDGGERTDIDAPNLALTKRRKKGKGKSEHSAIPSLKHLEKKGGDFARTVEQQLLFSWVELIRVAFRQFPDKLPFALVSVLAALITVSSQTNAIQSSDVFPVHLRLGNVCISYCRYLVGIFWPAELSIFYPIHWYSITPTSVITSIFVIGTVSILVCWNAGRRPYLLTGWFWFLISMLPVIGIVHVGAQSMADRYLYNASFGVFLAVVWLASEALTGSLRNLVDKRVLLQTLQIGGGVAVLILGATITVTTYRRCVRWQTELGPFYEAIDHDPTNWMAHLIVAEKLLEQGRYESAIEHTQAVTQEDSRFYVLHAFACRELGNSAEAKKLLKQAIELSPDNALALSMLAVIHAESDQATEAKTLLELAEQKLKLPVNQLQARTPPIVLRNCGVTLLQLGRTQEAIQRFEAAVSLDHRNADLVRDLAGAELQVELIDRAIERVQALTTTSPNDSASYSFLGLALKKAGRHVEAEQSLRRALELEPAQPHASLQLADILLSSGRIDEAKKALQDSLSHLYSRKVTRETQQWKGELNSQLGDVLLAKKDLSGAIRHYQAAIESTPDQFSANNNLAWLLATEPDPAVRDPEKAIQLAEHANALPGGQDKGSLGTLAAAYAAAGRIDEAIRTAEQALSLAEAKGDAASAAQLRTQLELHRQGKPLIESVLKATEEKD